MLKNEPGESASKEFNYFVTSIFSAFTAFTTWQTLKSQYYIFERRKMIRHIEKGEILEVDELVGKGKKVNDAVLIKVHLFLFRGVLEPKTENRSRSNRAYLKTKSSQFI
jgi:hypothetical protein